MKHIRTILLFEICVISVLLMLSVVGCKSKSETPAPEEQQQESPQEHKQPSSDSTQTDETAVVKYTYQWLDSKDIPPVSIVIDDFGQISGSLLQGFAELDDNITFAILPDLANSAKTAKLANVYGHEVILHIPMEALDAKQNPGKVFIKSGQDKAELKEIINGWLEQVPQAIGANNHMGSRTTSDYKTIYAVMDILNRKGLFFLDSKTNSKSKVVNAASELKSDYSARDIFLDVPDVSNATLNAKLKELEKFRGRVEPIIIISHCHNQAKLDAMRSFVSQLKGMGINLIPLSDAVNKFKLPT